MSALPIISENYTHLSKPHENMLSDEESCNVLDIGTSNNDLFFQIKYEDGHTIWIEEKKLCISKEEKHEFAISKGFLSFGEALQHTMHLTMVESSAPVCSLGDDEDGDAMIDYDSDATDEDGFKLLGNTSDADGDFVPGNGWDSDDALSDIDASMSESERSDIIEDSMNIMCGRKLSVKYINYSDFIVESDEHRYDNIDLTHHVDLSVVYYSEDDSLIGENAEDDSDDVIMNGLVQTETVIKSFVNHSMVNQNIDIVVAEESETNMISKFFMDASSNNEISREVSTTIISSQFSSLNML